MSGLYPVVTCPECTSPYYLKRLGTVGRRGVKDSRIIKCTVCNIVFRSKGSILFEDEETHNIE